jgi:hypothetical protein
VRPLDRVLDAAFKVAGVVVLVAFVAAVVTILGIVLAAAVADGRSLR